MAKAKQLFTIGYEGLSVDAFIARLRAAGIKSLVDVRELPLSRKRGFSKRALAATLEGEGIAYVHMPALGCPKAIRYRYKEDEDWAAYSRAFKAHLRRQGEAVRALVKHAKAAPSCLLCFEADFRRCHRSLVADAAASAGGPQVHHVAATATIPAPKVAA